MVSDGECVVYCAMNCLDSLGDKLSSKFRMIVDVGKRLFVKEKSVIVIIKNSILKVFTVFDDKLFIDEMKGFVFYDSFYA
tara:strand:+ start:543 stop:782 length:240 start_codon:yes stop_codon:yes gene_type:complete